MITRRIIPCLLLSGRKLVKTVKFDSPKYVGDPINAVKIFNDKEVDEIMILDIDASMNGTEPQFEYLKEVVSESFVPISYGGGITNLEQIDRLLQLGIEKVSLNSVNSTGFDLISQAAAKHGSQSIVAAVDLKPNIFGQNKVFFKNKKYKVTEEPSDYISKLEKAGAGEILINFVDRDGTYKGYNFDLVKKISSQLKVPSLFLGGAGSEEDFAKAFSLGASAVAAGSLFVFHGPHRAVLINYPDRKSIEKIIF
jgi:imidazole glycerol-phosphate synthase subunit HisF